MGSDVFPDPRSADENGIVCIGGKLSAPLLIEAYSQGIFPWPDPEFSKMLWFSPDPRGILPLRDFHVPSSLRKWAKKQSLRFVLNADFEKIVMNCGEVRRKGQSGTWITKDIIRSYTDLFEMGLAYSVAVYEGKDLVAGLYGVAIDRFVSAESMFQRKTNASKAALWAWGEFLQRHGQEWVDIQMVTSVSASFGGKELDRNVFLLSVSDSLQVIKSPTWWVREQAIFLTV